MKRIFDLIISALCLVIFSPLILLCAIAIRLDDGLPVIYTQERIGRNGKPFFIYKFRTMRMDAEENGPMVLEVDGDDRLTRVGKFLREHHLDELPQLWNVLIGDMAFIGPRPERRFYIDQIMQRDARYEQLYALRPGVTSYDTIDKMLKRLELDLYYLQHRSWWMDLRILTSTFLKIAGGKKF